MRSTPPSGRTGDGFGVLRLADRPRFRPGDMNTALAQYCRLLLARWRWVVWGILLACSHDRGPACDATCVPLKGDGVRAYAWRYQPSSGWWRLVRTGTGRNLCGPGHRARACRHVWSPILVWTLTPEDFSRVSPPSLGPGQHFWTFPSAAPSAAEAERAATVCSPSLNRPCGRSNRYQVRWFRALSSWLSTRRSRLSCGVMGTADYRFLAWCGCLRSSARRSRRDVEVGLQQPNRR